MNEPTSEQIHEAAVLVDAGHDLLLDGGGWLCLLAFIYFAHKVLIVWIQSHYNKRRNGDENRP